ncbi:MAG: beta-1,4-xylanase [Nevskiaceae bacterium]|nr:MAG: beta-1,4-xylanase [Nevskiaceae bacterium]
MALKNGICALVLLLAAPLAAPAASLPTPGIANSPGLSIHFTRGNTQDLDMMAAAGVKIVRTDFSWSATEYVKGVYDWSAYDELAANIVKRGMRPYFILDYSNALYEQVEVLWQNGLPHAVFVDSPRNPSSVAAFAAWARAAALHFQSQNVIWEIWNEPNLATFWKPQPNVADYSTLAKATCDAIHGAVPSAAVIGGVTSGIDYNFLTPFLGSGVLDCIDGVSVHPYRGATPETVSGEFQYLRWLIDQSAPAGRSGGAIPIVSGEWGYSTVLGGLSTADQASFLVRMQLINLFNNVPISIWYDWKNDGTDATNSEQNFGIVTSTLSPKPAYQALKTLTTQLSGYRIVQRVAVGGSLDCVLLMVNSAGKYKAVAWTLAANHALTLLNGFSANATIPVTDIGGSTRNVVIGWAGMSLPLTSSPQYLDLASLPIPAP